MLMDAMTDGIWSSLPAPLHRNIIRQNIITPTIQ